MATHAQKPETTYVLPPAGTHVARIYKFMNLGTRYQEYKGVQKEYADTLINISFELPNELHSFKVKNAQGVEEEVEKPFAISREFTLSMGGKSNLRPFVEGIIGVQLTDDEAYGFDLETLVGHACLITITHKKSTDGERTFANIVSTAPLMKGMTVPEPVNSPVVQNVNDMPLAEIEALPKFLADKIKLSDEYKRRTGGDVLPEYPVDNAQPDDEPY